MTTPEDVQYPDPTPADLDDPFFEVIWQAIKGWDLAREQGQLYSGATGNDVMHVLNALRPHLDAQAARIHALEAERDAILAQAQGWKQEARTANATIAEIYQLVTGKTGEPGNWHGAEPVRRALLAARGGEPTSRAQEQDRTAMIAPLPAPPDAAGVPQQWVSE